MIAARTVSFTSGASVATGVERVRRQGRSFHRLSPPANHCLTKSLVEALSKSQIFREYAKAFDESFGLPLAIRAIDSLGLPRLRVPPNEAPSCDLTAATNGSRAARLQRQQQVEQARRQQPQILKCFAGLCDSAVPIRVGQNVIAFLQTGGILLHTPSRREFRKATRELSHFGAKLQVKQLEEAYFQERALTKTQCQGVLRLLTIFAEHLAWLSNHIVISTQRPAPSMVARAKAFIADHHREELSMRQVAGFVNTSAFHFCRKFKEGTGLTFTEYLARLRVEKVKHLLLNPRKRVSEAAYESGFQSLSQFNRTFHDIVGESPRAWRAEVARQFSA